MNAAELVACLRAKHTEGVNCDQYGDFSECRTCYAAYPCPALIAADRIEALLNVPGDQPIGESPKRFVERVLNGEWP